jgi:hypothetical protein
MSLLFALRVPSYEVANNPGTWAVERFASEDVAIRNGNVS